MPHQSFAIDIDAASQTPPYEQLRLRLISGIESGALPLGSKLPTVRGLATRLGLAPNTVARSYRELEAAGYVRTMGRGGTIVALELEQAERHERALALSRDYLAAMGALGIAREEVAGFLDRA